MKMEILAVQNEFMHVMPSTKAKGELEQNFEVKSRRPKTFALAQKIQKTFSPCEKFFFEFFYLLNFQKFSERTPEAKKEEKEIKKGHKGNSLRSSPFHCTKFYFLSLSRFLAPNLNIFPLLILLRARLLSI